MALLSVLISSPVLETHSPVLKKMAKARKILRATIAPNMNQVNLSDLLIR